MFPTLSFNYTLDCIFANTEPLGKYPYAASDNAFTIRRPNNKDFFLCQLSLWVFFSLSLPAFRLPIGNVIHLGTGEKVSGVRTPWVVAFVENLYPCPDRLMMDSPRNAMSVDMLLVYPKYPIPIFSRPVPVPAPTMDWVDWSQLIDLFPETRGDGESSLHGVTPLVTPKNKCGKLVGFQPFGCTVLAASLLYQNLRASAFTRLEKGEK